MQAIASFIGLLQQDMDLLYERVKLSSRIK